MKPESRLLQNIVTRSSSPWMDGSGGSADVVISGRVRLARNLRDQKFPHLLDERSAKSVMDSVALAVNQMNGKEAVPPMTFVPLDDVSSLDRQVLVEKHLLSPQHAQPGRGRALVTRPDEKMAIMVNEEDHVRLQCLHSGLGLETALADAMAVDDLLDEVLDFAFDERSGYLTACPTNVGTGLRASVMVHLPALALADEVGRVLSAVNKLGLVVRGLYGEGTEGTGNVYQISNQITLGQTEKEIVEKLTLVANQVVAEEQRCRDDLLETKRATVEDLVWRAWGILTSARIMSSSEAVKLWSEVRLGVESGIVHGTDMKGINEILVISQPNFVMKSSGHALTPEERDYRRAHLIRQHLASV